MNRKELFGYVVISIVVAASTSVATTRLVPSQTPDISSISAELSRLDATLTSLQSTVSGLQSANASAQSSISSLQGSISSLRTLVTSVQNSLSSTQSALSTLNSLVSSLQSAVAQVQDTSYRLEIPSILGNSVNMTSLVSYMLTPLATAIKNRAPGNIVVSLAVDATTSAISGVLARKVKHFDVQIQSAAPVSTGVYNVAFDIKVPVLLSEIPGLATVVNVIGDYTFYINVPGTIQVNCIAGTANTPQYQINSISVGQ